MRTFKHRETGETLILNESHSAFSIVQSSPSWEEVKPELVEEKLKKTTTKK